MSSIFNIKYNLFDIKWECYISLHLSSYLLTVMLNKVKHLYKDSSLTFRMTGSVYMYIIT